MNKLALEALTTPEELSEALAIGRKSNATGLRLRYLKKSRQLMGQPYYDVLEPKLDGYRYGPDMGYPTFGLSTLIEKGILPDHGGV